jgi:O-antigen/teichoic acid export membrane protein
VSDPFVSARSSDVGPDRSLDILDTTAAGPAAIRGSALRAGGYLAGILLALATAPFLVRHLGIVGFGEYVLVLSLITVVSGLTDAGLTIVGIREYTVRDGDSRAALMRSLLGFRSVLTFLGVAAAVAFTIVVDYDRILVLGTLLAGLGLLLQTNQSLLTIPLASSLKLGWITAAELFRQLTTVVFIFALIIAGAELLPFFAVPVPAAALALAITVLLVRSSIPLKPTFRVREWGAMIRETLPYAIATFVNASYLRIAIVVLSLLATGLETGYFATSFRVLEVLIGLPGLLIAAVFPVIARSARDDPARFAYAVGRVFEVAVILGVWLTLAVELGAAFVIDVVGGDQAEPAVAVLRIQGVAVAATFVTMACGFPLLSLRRHADLLVANLVALAASLALLFALVPPYAARGAAVATVGAEVGLALATAALLVRARRDLHLPLDIVPTTLVVAAVAGSIALVPGLHETIRVAVASVVYFAVLVVFRRIPPELYSAWRLARGT